MRIIIDVYSKLWGNFEYDKERSNIRDFHACCFRCRSFSVRSMMLCNMLHAQKNRCVCVSGRALEKRCQEHLFIQTKKRNEALSFMWPRVFDDKNRP